eukprot:g25240.t1
MARLALGAYRLAGITVYPMAGPYLAIRAMKGKEDRSRRLERLGYASLARPRGPLIWVHAASVGETMAILPLIRELRRREIHVLLTTGTVTSAALVKSRLGDEVLHQYVPVDVKFSIKRFIAYWKPDACITAESEIWPTTVTELARRKIPQIRVNARLSDRSFERWRNHLTVAEALFDKMSLVVAQSDLDAERFRDLGAWPVIVSGNLKSDTDPPPCDEALLAKYKNEIGTRKTWAAISTFDGEEKAAAAVHKALKPKNGQLTIIVPRHPDRADAVESMLKEEGLSVARRSRGEAVTAETDVFLGDSIGEMGLYLRLTEIAFVGRSLSNEGGQNPLEPAMIGCAVLTGPNIQNFRDAYQHLVRKGGARVVRDMEMLAKAVHYLMITDQARRKMVDAGCPCRYASLMAGLQAGIAGILFDKDGTLLRYDESWGPVNREAARIAACGNADLVPILLKAGGMDPQTGKTKADSLLAAGNAMEIAAGFVAAGSSMDVALLAGELDALFVRAAEFAVPVTDLKALFRRLKDLGLKLGIASSDNERAIRRTAAHFAIEDYVDFVAGYDSGFGVKPSPGMVLGFAEAVGLDPGQIGMVGDNNHDMLMGRSAHAALTVAVLTGTAPPFWWEEPDWRARALMPFSAIYGKIAGRRMAAKTRMSAPVPVICVGNFTVGGAGKTPTAIALARAAKQIGHRPGFLSRGYGGSLDVTTIVDAGHHRAEAVGDEALLLAAETLTVVSRRRVDGAHRLAAEGADLIIMDDGFQSARLYLDFALVVIDTTRGIGNGHLIPGGPVRAPIQEQMRQLSAILKVGNGNAADQIVRRAAKAGKPVYVASIQPRRQQALAGRNVLAYAGIADPAKFYRTVQAVGGLIGATRSFPDHHYFSEDEIQSLLDDAERQGLALVTTAKDAARLSGHSGQARVLLERSEVIDIDIVFDDPRAPAAIIDAAFASFRQRRLRG